MPTLRIELEGEDERYWWKWIKLKSELKARSNKELLINLMKKYEESKGRDIL